MKREPQRTCIGCRQVRRKVALLRLVRGDDGRVEIDWGVRCRGRGAYVCASVECLTKALVKGQLDRTFKGPSVPPTVGVTAILARLGDGDARTMPREGTDPR